MITKSTVKAGERTRIKNPSPQVAAMYAEEDGRFGEAAQLYQVAGDMAGGHGHAENMYAKARACLAKAEGK